MLLFGETTLASKVSSIRQRELKASIGIYEQKGETKCKLINESINQSDRRSKLMCKIKTTQIGTINLCEEKQMCNPPKKKGTLKCAKKKMEGKRETQ
ncbi:hypothetical protein MIMGU_mgv11b014252mg [Erythranthe guttata]|uniref:Uncharacterized protein n=1 Tax=Erythranthe guttata TaxID=4155 RepID=A0A022QQB4_ERYGU|nr:hypothetical protein MIMGU_mgv11b014252mg [Erythranthe guttata]